MKRMIIGSEGEIGLELQKEGDDIVTIDLKESKNKNHHIIDVTDTKKMIETIEKERPDEIIFLAALLINDSKKDPELAKKVNHDSLVSLFEIIDRQKIKAIFISSIAVYSKEGDLNPSTVYGKLKLKLENKIHKFNLENHNNPIKILRLPSVIDIKKTTLNGITSFVGHLFNTKNKRLFIPVNKDRKFPGLFLEDINIVINHMFQLKETIKDVEAFTLSAGELEEKINKYKSLDIISKVIDDKQKVLDSWPETMNQNIKLNIKLTSIDEQLEKRKTWLKQKN